jgi:hypothetical protein
MDVVAWKETTNYNNVILDDAADTSKRWRGIGIYAVWVKVVKDSATTYYKKETVAFNNLSEGAVFTATIDWDTMTETSAFTVNT